MAAPTGGYFRFRLLDFVEICVPLLQPTGMAGPAVFNVTFGINETLLTQALEEGRYEQARHMVEENAHSTYLDEGCYQRTPFYIVLCGRNAVQRPAPRHLHLAKLLTEHGADVNYRVPAMSMGAEYVDPGQSAVELLTDLYNELTAHSEPQRKDMHTLPFEMYGLDRHLVSDVDECVDQLLSLILTMMTHGGDLYVRDWYGMAPLHRTVLYSRDIRLTRLLADWGADLNAQDVFGNTPLGALCEAFPRGLSLCIEELEEEGCGEDYTESDWLLMLTRHASYQRGKTHFLTFLLEQKGLKVDVQNKYGCTALFNAVMRGETTSCYHLLRHGADPTLKAQVTSLSPKENREISPLFASMLSMRMWEVSAPGPHCPGHERFMAHLVDQGFFSRAEIASELHAYIDAYFPAFRHLKLFGCELLGLLFGQLSASLRQLSARAVFRRYGGAWRGEVGDAGVARALVRSLRLPRSSVLHFEVELLRLALFRKFAQFHRISYNIDGDDDSDDSSGENDSDIEYWEKEAHKGPAISIINSQQEDVCKELRQFFYINYKTNMTPNHGYKAE